MSVTSVPWKLLLERFEKRTLTVLVLITVFIAGLTVAGTNNFFQSSSGDLVAEYRFEEGGGTTAYDTAGGNDGTLNNFNFNADSGWTDGKRGKALEFDGNDDEFLGPGSFEPYTSDSDPWTISVWFQIQTLASSAGHDMTIVDNNNRYHMQLNDGDDGMKSIPGGNSFSWNWQPSKGEWHHAVLVYDGDGTAKAYADTELKRVVTGITPYESDLDGGEFALGSHTGSRYFDGLIDNARVYSRALDQSEIKALYNQGGFSVGKEGTASGKVLDMGFTRQNSTHVFDISGNYNHGEPVNGASQETAVNCKVGRCYSFDGNNDYVDVGDDDSIDITNDGITMMAWVHTDGQGDNEIISKEDEYLMAIENQQLYIRTWGDNNGGSTNDVPSNKWAHVAISWNNNNHAQVYINGELDENATVSDSNSGTINPLVIGKRSGSSSQYFDGKLDQVKIYNRTLSQQEIIEETEGLSSDGAVFNMRFDNAGGDHVEDHSTHDNHGTLQPNETFGPTRINGIQGNALKFDKNRIDVGTDSSMSLDTTESFSFSTWIRRAPFSGRDEMILNHGGTDIIRFVVLSGSSGMTYYSNSDNDWTSTRSTTDIDDSTWHHLVWKVKDGEFSLYVDGEHIETSSLAYDLPNVDGYVDIGDGAGSSEDFLGSIDNIKLFQYAISESKVKQLYRRGASRIGNSERSEQDPGREGLVLDQSFDRVETCGNSDTLSCPSGISGELAVDESGEANHGELVNGPTEENANECKIGKCLKFGGGSVDVSYSEVLNDTLGTLPVTISMWYKPTEDVSDWKTVMPWTGSYSGGTGSVRVEVDGQQSALYTRWIAQDGSANWARGGGTGIETGEWYFHTSVITENQIKTFTNGNLHSSSSHSFYSLANLNSDLSITPSFLSFVDQVRIYNQSLSNQEIWSLYTQGRDRTGSSGMPGPVGWWRMDGWDYRKPVTLQQTDVNYSGVFEYVNITLDTGFASTDPEDEIRVVEASTDKEVPSNVIESDIGGDWAVVAFKGSVSTVSSSKYYIYYGNPSPSNKSKVFRDYRVDFRAHGNDWDAINPVYYWANNDTYVPGPEWNANSGTAAWQEWNDINLFNMIHTKSISTMVNEGETREDTSGDDSVIVRDLNCDMTSDPNFGGTNPPYCSNQGDKHFGLFIAHDLTYGSGCYSVNPFTLVPNEYSYTRTPDDLNHSLATYAYPNEPSYDSYTSNCDGNIASFTDDTYTILPLRNLAPVSIGNEEVADRSGEGNAGSLQGNPKRVDGKVGKALDFDGSGDYVSVPHSSTLNIPSENDRITIATWVHSKDWGDSTQTISHLDGVFYLDNKGVGDGVRFYLVNSDTGTGAWNKAILEWNGILSSGWNHITATYNGTAQKIYIDGKLKEKNNSVGVDVEDGTGDLKLGDRDSLDRPFNGTIDDVRVYPYALSQNQIRQVMNQGSVSLG